MTKVRAYLRLHAGKPHKHQRERCSTMSRRNLIDLLVTSRNAAGLTQAQLATRAKVSAQQVSRWERGTAVPGPKVLPRLAAVLGIPESDLYAAAIAASQQETKQVRRESNEMRGQYDKLLDEMRIVVTDNREINRQIGIDIAELRDALNEMVSMLRDALDQRVPRGRS